MSSKARPITTRALVALPAKRSDRSPSAETTIAKRTKTPAIERKAVEAASGRATYMVGNLTGRAARRRADHDSWSSACEIWAAAPESQNSNCLDSSPSTSDSGRMRWPGGA